MSILAGFVPKKEQRDGSVKSWEVVKTLRTVRRIAEN